MITIGDCHVAENKKSVRGFKITPVYSIDEDLYQELGFRIEKNGSHFYSVDLIRCLKALFEEIRGTTILRKILKWLAW